MSQSLSQVFLHVVFSTKHRAPYLKGRQLRGRVHAYLAGACDNLDCPVILVGGVEDRACVVPTFAEHFCFRLRSGTKAGIVKMDQHSGLVDFHWQGGYGAFSISPSHLQPLRRYIENQEEHHRTVTFQDEFRRLCTKYGVAIDERYVWG